jgi:hypothetical protein
LRMTPFTSAPIEPVRRFTVTRAPIASLLEVRSFVPAEAVVAERG